jgi:glycosyltransferase involved in cell wall biosynthesis
LRVGVLTYGLDRPLSGIGRSIVELGRALRRRPDVSPVFLTPYGHGPFVEANYRSTPLRGARLLPLLMTLGAAQLPVVARRQALRLIHDPTGVSPFLVGRSVGPYKRVVTLHDAIAFTYPQGYTRLNVFLQRAYIPRTLPNVDAVVTVSEASRRDLSRYMKIPLDKLHVVPNAADAAFRPMPPDGARAVAARHGLEQPYILTVGALQARKNLPTLVKALAALRHDWPGLTLAIVGRPVWGYAELPRLIRQVGLEDAVRFTGQVPDEDLPALYGAAELLCFPSLYEGFGLPALEAMACGTPVVCSTVPALAEVARGAALLVDPLDHEGFATAITHVLGDPRLAEDLRQRGLARARDFSWDRAAEQLVGVYTRVLEVSEG